ncbi:MAG: YafY family protein, partial [Pseudomonadota bacterium]
RRADRLFQIVQLLRGGRRQTARSLADALEVSERTIYRDIVDLQGSGVPVEGEAGFGYVMQDGFDLPPLMFTNSEIAALVAGARLIRAWGGVDMARGAEEALIKIEAVLDDAARARAKSVSVQSYDWYIDEAVRVNLDVIDGAVDTVSRLSFDYADKDGARTRRTIRPLLLNFWGRVWTCVGWCELRDDFRMFRVDRMTALVVGSRYRPQSGQSLRDFYAQVQAQGGPDLTGAR